MRQKNFDGKSWYPPFLSIKIFDNRIFLIHRSVPHRNLSVLWDEKFTTVNNGIPFLCIIFFNTRYFLKHWRVPHQIFSVLWDKHFRLKIVKSPPPLFSKISFSIPKFSQKQKDSPPQFFGTVRQKSFDGKSLYPPPLIHIFFWFQKFSEKQNGPLTKFFVSVLRDRKFSTEKRVTPPSYPELFLLTRNFLKHRKIPFRSFSALWDKKFRLKILISPLPSYP